MPHKGYKQTTEHIRKVSEAHKGHKLSEETRRKISKAHKGRRGYKHSEKAKRKISKARIAYMKKNEPKYFNTSIELAIESELKRRGINHEKQEHVRGVGLVDFLLPDLNIIIECDGNYWHSREGAKQKDIRRDRRSLCIHKYQTFRFTETQINESPAKCIDQIFIPPKLLKSNP